MSFLGAGFEVFDDMIIDSSIDVAGDLAEDGLDFVENPSFVGAVELVTGYTNFGVNVGIDMAEDTVDIIENEINPDDPVSTTTTSTSNGVTNIYNITKYYGCPPCAGTTGVFDNAFDSENVEEEITFGVAEPEEPPPQTPIC